MQLTFNNISDIKFYRTEFSNFIFHRRTDFELVLTAMELYIISSTIIFLTVTNKIVILTLTCQTKGQKNLGIYFLNLEKTSIGHTAANYKVF